MTGAGAVNAWPGAPCGGGWQPAETSGVSGGWPCGVVWRPCAVRGASCRSSFLLRAGAAAAGALVAPSEAHGQPAARVHWIWHKEADPTRPLPAGTVRYFRRAFTIDRPVQQPVDEAMLDVAATGRFIVWVNGAQVGKGED